MRFVAQCTHTTLNSVAFVLETGLLVFTKIDKVIPQDNLINTLHASQESSIRHFPLNKLEQTI